MAPLLLLPGLGADGTLFAPQVAGGLAVRVLEWIPAQPKESLPAYARRMAERVEPDPGLVLGGVSMGGMVAFEMARHLRPRALVLIASCRSAREIGPVRRFGAGVAGVTTSGIAHPPRVAWPAVAWVLGAHREEHKTVLYRFLAAAEPAFVAWGLSAIRNWRPETEPACPIRQIHGRDDRVIPAGRVSAERLVPGAGHLLNVTHFEEVNAFLASVVGEG